MLDIAYSRVPDSETNIIKLIFSLESQIVIRQYIVLIVTIDTNEPPKERNSRTLDESVGDALLPYSSGAAGGSRADADEIAPMAARALRRRRRRDESGRRRRSSEPCP